MGITKKTHETTIFTFSHSSLSMMEQCPRKWFLRYMARHYFYQPQPWTDFGLLVHYVAELYRGEGGEHIKKLARKIAKEKNLKVHPDYIKKIPVALRNLKRYYDKFLAKAKYLKTEKEFRTDLTEYVDLVGLVDVLYKNEDDEWVIGDFKTSKQKGEHSKQLATYYWLMREMTGKKPKTLKCQVIYLSQDSMSEDIDDFVQEYVLDEEDIEACERRLQAGINVIANCGTDKNKWRKKPNKLCDYCIFKEYNLCNAIKE